MARMELRDKVVLLTGAAGGIGHACSLELAARGARLLLADIDGAGLEATARGVRARGGEAHCLYADLARTDAVDRLAEDALAVAGHVDVLWSNAGVMLAGRALATEWSDYAWLAQINLWAPLRLTHRLLPAMLERGAGHVVVTASLNGLVTAPGTAAYGLTKAGLLAWFEALRAEIRGSGVGVTLVCPGFVRTGLFERGRVRDRRLLERTRTAPACVGLAPAKVARVAVRAVERRRPVVTLGAERATLWLKHVSVRAYDRYNALLARFTLDDPEPR